jgi:FMN reductase
MDVLDNDLLVGEPIMLAATAGSARHSLVVDEQMRPLFAYMRALTLPDVALRGARGLELDRADRAHPARRERARRVAARTSATRSARRARQTTSTSTRR